MKIVTTTLFLIFILIFSICSGSVSAAASDSSGKYETTIESPALNTSNSSEDTSSPAKSSDDGKVYALAAPSTSLTVKNQIYSQLASITPSYGSEDYQYISVKNNGTTAATNVVVSGTTSQNAAFNIIEWWTSWDNQVTYTKNDSAFVYNPSTGAWTWTIGNLAAGKTVYLDIRMLISKTGSITSTATATAANANTVSKAFTTNVPSSPTPNIDLQLTNSFSNANPTPGSTNTLTINVANAVGLTTASNVIVNDGLPAEAVITSWRVGTYILGWSWTPNDPSYNPWTGVWNVGDLWKLLGQGNKQLEITFTVPSISGITGVVSTVYGDQNDPNLANNYDKASFTVAGAMMAVDQSNSLAAQSEQTFLTSQASINPNAVETDSQPAITLKSANMELIEDHGAETSSTNTEPQDTGITEIILSLILSLLGTISSVALTLLGALVGIPGQIN